MSMAMRRTFGMGMKMCMGSMLMHMGVDMQPFPSAIVQGGKPQANEHYTNHTFEG
jgi:hypothetical protein